MIDPRPLTPEELEAATIEAARKDFCLFAEYVGRDERDNSPIKCSDIHRRWAQLCNDHDDVIIWAHRNAGKSSQLSILRTLWELGRNPNLRYLILAKTLAISVKILRSISLYITSSEELRKVFPRLRPNPEGPWTTTELQVMRKSTAKDPSVRAEGANGSLAGGRVDRLIVDDILDDKIVNTQAARDELESWYGSVVRPMLSKDARRIVVGTAFHPDDILHRWSRKPGVYVARFPLLDRNNKVTWPEEFPPHVVEKIRSDVGPLNFARQYMCLARDDGEAEFQESWIELALRKGEGLTFVHDRSGLPADWRCFTGVDLAASKNHRSDETILFTFAQDPTTGTRRLLNIEAGKFMMPEIMKKCISHHDRYDSDIMVETNAAQAYVFQQLKQTTNVRVYSHTTGGNKHDPVFGVLGLTEELEKGTWEFPNTLGRKHPELVKFISEMLFYNPKGHTGDRLMACWFARERARQVFGRALSNGRVNVRVIGADRAAGSVRDADGRTELERIFDVPGGDQ